MFLSDLSIKRPVFASVLMLALVTLGIFSYRRLSIDEYPDVEIPVISIITLFPGASPETVEREVSKRIEEAVNPIPGVKHVTSTSREGVSMVVVEFKLEIRINEASQEARAKINAIRGDLPQGIQEPIIQKLDFAAMPVASVAVRSDRISPREITTLVEKKIKRRLENLSGVGKADIVGDQKREVSILMMPDRINALGMGVDEVIGGLAAENVNTPLGRLTDGNAEFSTRISGKPVTVDQFNGMVIGSRNGRPVMLSEVADIRDGIREQRTLALIDGVPAVALDILKQSGANTVDVVEAVKKELRALQAELPAGITLDLVRDGSIMIRDSVNDVQETLIIGGILTVIIVFLFLNSWRSTVITGLTLPISVISAFIVMNFGGMTLNVMTLMALSLAIGLLIDDAIVVRENIVRHLEHGKDHFQAARDGTSEIGLAVLATTFSIVAVFVPVAFMKGIVGRFFFQFGITITFAVLVSLFVSFTLDPMLSSRWVDPSILHTSRRSIITRLLDVFNRQFDRLADSYRFIIGWSLRKRYLIVLMAIAAFVGGMALFGSMESEFMVSQDQSEFQVTFVTAPGASFQETRGRLETILARFKAIPEIERTYATIGAGDQGTVRDGAIYVRLANKEKRSRGQFEIMRQARSILAEVPGIEASIQEAGRLDNRKPLLLSIRGEDLNKLKDYSARLKKLLQGVPGVVDLDATLEYDLPEFRFTVDRQHATDAGLSTADVVRTLSALVGGQAVSTYEDEDGDAVDVRVRLPEDLRRDPEQVKNLFVTARTATGAPSLIPLGNLLETQRSVSPSSINRNDLSREVVVQGNLDRLALGTAVAKATELAAQVKMEPGYRLVFSGENEDMVETFGYMAESLMLAVLFVYLILAAQFESFVDPFSIMLSLPLSVVGMAGMLKLTGDTINIMSLIGLIMLMGLVTKNAILLVDYAKILRSRGKSRFDAVVEAGRTRLRPIMMTTLAMIFGMLPLALGVGAGGEFRAPMGRAVVGGLITSTFLTLLVVPVVYTLLDDVVEFFRRRRARRHPGVAHSPAVHAEGGAGVAELVPNRIHQEDFHA